MCRAPVPVCRPLVAGQSSARQLLEDPARRVELPAAAVPRQGILLGASAALYPEAYSQAAAAARRRSR
ncbi:MAG: hypothetical protein LC644_07500 [Pseudonocardia sp.]|nr:hypothetical protein [Pseudonocardia sp.]